ncbi:MAG TPA: 3-oxoacyl-[acyl-carrier-protein] synthase III C-terminal domain-containing protein [Conexibacter sp.]|jgi:alkylresorcinol/alkylpyrone synthase|nr:3-oxoacyl-[acyl-carrier-protein] synthase III C-terminal domain-containing protein [Conexibacter sp.]
MNVRVNEIAVANPASSYTQAEMLELLGLAGDDFARMIFERCGVERRHFELTPDILDTTLQERTAQTEEQLLRLATEAIDRLEIEPDQIGTVITATYYSLGGPTLAHKLLAHYGMDPATDKYHVVGVGCASAVPLFKIASQSMRDHPGKHALVVAAESITGFLTAVDEDDEQVKTIGSSLFGDGCAAAVLTNGASTDGPAILAARQHQIEDTLGTVHFRLNGDDSFMQIGRELPKLARRRLLDLVQDFLAEAGTEIDAIDHWIVHPGGRGIIDGVQNGLGLTDEDVAISRDVLARFGNMGTPSSFYVLRETIARRAPQPGERGLVVTIGPGVTVGLMLLSW